MEVLHVRNVHEALPRALQLLYSKGVTRGSRNGPVLHGPSVTTVYEKPLERVLFWPARDANPFLHLYESLWMLAGRRDVAGPSRYAKQMREYSDDGEFLHGAYGYRWRKAFGGDDQDWDGGIDQLKIIAERLQSDPTDRRCVLQMWDTAHDLGRIGKDFPCNTIATLQLDWNGKLNLAVFCRSNDIVWGAYGANAVQFSTLLEYMALWIGCEVGTYSQISINWHGYLSTLGRVESIRPDRLGYVENPYTRGVVSSTPMGPTLKLVDYWINAILLGADNELLNSGQTLCPSRELVWARNVYLVLAAHERYRQTPNEESRYIETLGILGQGDQNNDWIVAAREWVTRRYELWRNRIGLQTGSLSHL